MPRVSLKTDNDCNVLEQAPELQQPNCRQLQEQEQARDQCYKAFCLRLM